MILLLLLSLCVGGLIGWSVTRWYYLGYIHALRNRAADAEMQAYLRGAMDKVVGIPPDVIVHGKSLQTATQALIEKWKKLP